MSDGREGRIRPGDRHLMQAGIEYLYIDCDVSYEANSATARITRFDLDSEDYIRHDDVTEEGLRALVAEYEADGWQHTRAEHGREYEGHYFQRAKPAS